jgi:tRNA (cmo5U34)-methyltransferase
MNEFDIKAADWDMNPMHRDRSEAIADEIRRIIPLNKEMTALEYGAGTGLTSFLLMDQLKHITLMDNSTEMVRVMNEKLKNSKAGNLSVINFDLELNDYEISKFDLIITQMVLHHVNDTALIIERFSRLLNSGGYLAIADLCEEDGSFHGEGFTGHRGFNVEKIVSMVKDNGFVEISNKTCYVIERKISETENKKFEVFLITARKV